MDTIILYIGAVVVFYAAMQGALYFASDLREETQKAANQLRRVTLADGVSPWLREILLTKSIRRFDNIVQTCGLKLRTDHVLLFMMLSPVLVMLCFELLMSNPTLSLSIGIVVGAGLPLLLLTKLRNRRMRKLTGQLPETLDMMVRSLKAGHPIPAAISMVAKGMPDPVGSEFKLMFEAMTFGLSLREALTRMTERLHTVTELKYIVSAIRIQSTSGGNLAEILESLSKLMREQQKLKMKIRAMSAEGRLSGFVLAGLPIFVIVAVNILSPTYYAKVMESTGLMTAMGVAAFLLVLGIVLVRRIVIIRV